MESERYERNLPVLGEEGQKKLAAGSVLIIGAGGLGCPAALYLAAAGVGTIGICDDDTVSLSNLQRQILYNINDIAKPKAETAKEKLIQLNPEINIRLHPLRYEKGATLFQEYDFIIDAVDNFTGKKSISEDCITIGKAFCHGSAAGMMGQVFTCVTGGPSYRDLMDFAVHENHFHSGKTNGILGSVAGVIGAIQATEAIKYLSGTGQLLTGKLLVFDGLNMKFDIIKF